MKKKFNSIWIIGASSGIGEALCEVFQTQNASAPSQIIISARNAQALQEMSNHSDHIHPFAFDITDKAALSESFEQLLSMFSLPDLVVIAAGTYLPMPLDQFSAKTARDHMNINYLGVVNCLEVLMPAMRRRGSGEIAVLASLSGYRGLPKAAAYGPTKAALINLCETLHGELEDSGVLLRVINPGFVKTRLTDKNDFVMPYLQTPREAAHEIYQQLTRNNNFEIAFPKPFVRQLKIARILPYWLYFKLIKKLSKKR